MKAIQIKNYLNCNQKDLIIDGKPFVVANDVKRSDGVLLLKSGTKLTPSILRLLYQRNIRAIYIKNNELDDYLNDVKFNNRFSDEINYRIKIAQREALKRNYSELDKVVMSIINDVKNNSFYSFLIPMLEKEQTLDKAISIAEVSLKLANICKVKERDLQPLLKASLLCIFGECISNEDFQKIMLDFCKNDLNGNLVNGKDISLLRNNVYKTIRGKLYKNGMSKDELDKMTKNVFSDLVLNYNLSNTSFYNYLLFPNIDIKTRTILLHQDDTITKNDNKIYYDNKYLTQNNISDDTIKCSSILKIAHDYDMYLNLSDEFIYPIELIDYMISKKIYDNDILEQFRANIPSFNLGEMVMLSNGLNGIVIRNNINNINSPVVRVIENGDIKDINLATEDISIVDNKNNKRYK